MNTSGEEEKSASAVKPVLVIPSLIWSIGPPPSPTKRATSNAPPQTSKKSKNTNTPELPHLTGAFSRAHLQGSISMLAYYASM